VLNPLSYTCNEAYTTRGTKLGISQYLRPVSGTNWVPRMSTGMELQVMLPVINAPFRIYYAYNAVRLDSTAVAPIAITRTMFPYCSLNNPKLPTCQNLGAGFYTYQLTRDSLSSTYTLREPRKTFRFTVATTF
jgi:outer membrane protein insertion porin family